LSSEKFLVTGAPGCIGAWVLRILVREGPTSHITFEFNRPLPFPADLDDSGLRGILGTIPHTPLRQAIRDTLSAYQNLLTEDLIALDVLG